MMFANITEEIAMQRVTASELRRRMKDCLIPSLFQGQRVILTHGQHSCAIVTKEDLEFLEANFKRKKA